MLVERLRLYACCRQRPSVAVMRMAAYVGGRSRDISANTSQRITAIAGAPSPKGGVADDEALNGRSSSCRNRPEEIP